MTATVFGPNEIILLIGAGASVEADIPDSKKMVHEIENLVSSDTAWTPFKDLYHYIRSSIFYADGLTGTHGEDVSFNIERLVNVLEELQKRERHTLYPFVGAWNPKLQDVAGARFEHVGQFRDRIIDILRRRWIELSEKDRASYYKGLLRFQNEYEFPLRVFSLNYDLCVEETCGEKNVHRGFPMGDREWDWRSFDETSDDPVPLMLYKLHGSADWYFTDGGRVAYSDSPSTIKDEAVAIIFGTSYKLQYVDPFLFLAYELRRWTLDSARIIICVGYGFNDDHINGILQQSLRQEKARMLLAVVGGDTATASEKKRVSEQLKTREDQIQVRAIGAKAFLENDLTLDSLSKLFPVEEDLFSELQDSP